MIDFFGSIKPETTITLGFLGLMLAAAVFIVVKGVFIPKATHLRELKVWEQAAAQAIKDRDQQVKDMRAELTVRMDNFRSDHAARLSQVREDHAKQLEALSKIAEGVRLDFAAVLTAKQRDADDWRAAYHIIAENAKISEDRMDQVLEFERLSHAVLESVRRIVSGEVTVNHRDPSTGQRELPSGPS